MRLSGKIAIVTGGARGIGKAIARRFVAEGASVVIGDVLEKEGRASAQEIGDACRYQPCDVRRKGDIEGLVEAAVNTFGRLDICVNNAAVLRNGPVLELEEEAFDEVIAVNLRGAFLTAQAAARQMVAQGGGGAIINLSSINAVFAIPGQTAYTVSKGGIHMLTRSLAIQLADHGIRVNAIGPGTIETEMSAGLIDETFIARIPLRRPGRPEEIASIAAFLASEEASYIVGQTIYADGGRLALNLTVPQRHQPKP